ncbi:type IX secretion system protein PorG [Solitalea canadensis]|uniref:DUF6089 domain-containing protein n=1 Tax=Solitalea canadensis (strain ATCC 29591 / DSM 3403 / JCM 21819 / LMG 8368 / NBRC 15130 / NCIMB 12057 / USAM 9D) TaxID=929556 RepID=H8KP53_SOLCM|nr:DUF6089 family protein [Solitalea canadensis]AFD05690.1 hypothetical protein Solca_0560 [Solitalea canadensis DSM 3403]
MFKKITAVLTVLVLIVSINASAQKYELGAFVGGAGYKGDLSQFNYFRFTDAAFGIIFRKNFNPRNALKVTLTHGKVQANDATSGIPDQERRNLRFESPINELSVQYEFNFFSLNPFKEGEVFSPYLSAGLSVFNFDPQAENGQRLQPLGTEGQGLEGYEKRYRLTTLSVPLAFGLKYQMTERWKLFSELGYRITFTDYIDDVSGYYANLSSVPSTLTRTYADRSAEAGYASNLPGNQRGDLLKKDMYMFAVVGITFSFVSSRCPTF